MLIFAKDITEREHKHSREGQDPELKAYMEYQRKLFPYTIVRAGLDLASTALEQHRRDARAGTLESPTGDPH